MEKFPLALIREDNVPFLSCDHGQYGERPRRDVERKPRSGQVHAREAPESPSAASGWPVCCGCHWRVETKEVRGWARLPERPGVPEVAQASRGRIRLLAGGSSGHSLSTR